MFCIVFVFSCILKVLEENPSNYKIITKSAYSLLERFNSKSILNLRKENLAKISYFWKKSRMSMSLYFNNNFLFEYWIAMILVVLVRFFLIWMFTMPKLPRNKGPQICINLESFSYLDWNFKKGKDLYLFYLD
jgi:hypothetical protein